MAGSVHLDLWYWNIYLLLICKTQVFPCTHVYSNGIFVCTRTFYIGIFLCTRTYSIIPTYMLYLNDPCTHTCSIEIFLCIHIDSI